VGYIPFPIHNTILKNITRTANMTMKVITRLLKSS
jgi:hypothetical protein